MSLRGDGGWAARLGCSCPREGRGAEAWGPGASVAVGGGAVPVTDQAMTLSSPGRLCGTARSPGPWLSVIARARGDP